MNKTLSPFDYLNSILESGDNIYNTGMEGYNSYIVLRGIMQQDIIDIILANQVNIMRFNPILQYYYLLFALDKFKRPRRKWDKQKESNQDNIKIISRYRQCSEREASYLEHLYSLSEIEYIKGIMDNV